MSCCYRHAAGVLALVTLLTTSGCTTGRGTSKPPSPPAVTASASTNSKAPGDASVSDQPASTTIPTVARPVASPSPPATSASAAASSSSAAPTTLSSAPPRPVAKPPFYASNPVCAKVRCELLAAQNGIPHLGGKLRLEVIALPKSGESVEREMFLALYDSTGKALYTTSKIEAYFIPRSEAALPGFTGISVDRAGRVFVPFGTGAHSSLLVALDPSIRPVRTFKTLPSEGMRFFSDTPSSGALDVDGDGINEVVVIVNDYQPSYAEGTSTAYYFKYKGGDFRSMGCTRIAEATDISKPPQSTPMSKVCNRSKR